MADETPAPGREKSSGELIEERLLAIEEKLGLGQFSKAAKAEAKAAADTEEE